MAKFNLKDKVEFMFAGSKQSGEIVLIEKSGEVKIFDGKYYYRRTQNLLTKIKDELQQSKKSKITK